MALDLSKDYLLFDDPITVLYSVRLTENTWEDSVAVPYCQRNAVMKEDIAANSSLLGKVSSVFHLWKALLGDIVPKVKDRVEFDDEVWKVESVGKLDRDANGVQRYRLVVTKL